MAFGKLTHPTEYPGNVFRVGSRGFRLGLLGPQLRDPFDPLGRRQLEQFGPGVRRKRLQPLVVPLHHLMQLLDVAVPADLQVKLSEPLLFFLRKILEPFLELIAVRARIVDSPALPEQVCSDEDDDKFLACAVAGRAKIIVSGDKALLKVSGYGGISVVKPRDFAEKYLKKQK